VNAAVWKAVEASARLGGACQKLSCKVRWVVVNCIIKVKVKVYR